MADIGTAYVRIAPNMTGIQSKIAAGMKGAGGQATRQLGNEINSGSGHFQKSVGRLSGIAKVGGLAIAGGLAAGAAGIAALAGKMLIANAQLEQQLGGSQAVFGEYAKGVQKIAQDSYKNMGLSQSEFLAGANKMGSLYQGSGISVQKSMEMSSASIQRATDVASIMGIDTSVALESVTAMAKGNYTMMDNLGVAMNDTAINAYALEKGIGKTTAQMTSQEKAQIATQMFMEKTAKYAGNYAKENETLAGSINTTQKAFDDFLSGGGDIGNFVDSLVKTIQIAVPKIVEMLPKIVSGLGSILSGLVGALSAALPVLIPALITAVQSLFNALIAAMPMIVQSILQALPLLITAFVQLFMAILQALPQIVPIISEAIPTIVDALVNGLTSPEAITAVIMGAVTLLIAIVRAIPILIAALTKAIPTIVSNFVRTLTSPQFISALINAGVQLLQGVVAGIGKMGASVGRAAMEVIKIIMRTLAPRNLWDIGVNVIKGLWEGIKSMGNWLKDNIISFVKDKIPEPVRKALGIQSPSKLFAEFGRNIDQGLANGITKNAGLVSSSVDKMTNGLINSMATSGVVGEVAVSGPSSKSISAPSRSGSNTSQTVTIENVYLGNQSAVKEFFKQLNQDTVNVGAGLTPIQGVQP